MKRKLLSVAVAVAAAAPLSTFAAGPTVYGRLDLSTEYETRDIDAAYVDGGVDDFDSDRWLVRSNSSRFGVKGDAQLMGGLKGIYQAEFGIKAEDTSESISGRNTYAGLQGNFGTLLMGRKDTPLKEAQGKVDLFNDTIADIQYYFGGEERASNAIGYSSPLLSKAFQVNLMVIEKEEWDKDGTGADKEDAKNGPLDSWSTSVTYTEGSNYFALAYDNEVSTKWGILESVDADASSGTPFLGDAHAMDTIRLVGQFGLDSLTLGGMFESSESSDDIGGEDLEANGFMLNAAFKLDTRNTVKFQLAQTTTELGDLENEITEVALGWDNKLSDTSKLYALLAENTSEISNDADDAEGSQMNFAVGLQHNF